MPVPGGDEAAPSAITNHSAHPGHKLRRMADDGQLFVCDGCKEPGAGARYTCEHERCDFDLHTFCAVAPDRLTHPAFGAHRVFLFLQEPEPRRATNTEGEGGKGRGRTCAAVTCRKPVRGFVYHCFDDGGDGDGIDLHPCCALLPEHAIIPDNGLVAAASRRRGTSESNDGNEQSRSVHHRVLPASRYRQRNRRHAENTQPMNNDRVLEVHRQEVPRPRDAPCDTRNRGREHAPAPARHRWLTWKR